MALPQVQLIINAVNNASKTLKEVAADINKFDLANKNVIDSSKKFALGVTAAGAAIAAFGYVTVKAASEAQVQIAKMDATLKAMGDTSKKTRDQILQAAGAVTKLGFDDETAAVSIAKLYQRTGDLTEATKLNSLAMDLARAKNIDLATASDLVGQVMSGNGRVLKAYGIDLAETGSSTEALSELQGKLAGQAEAFANTFQGQMEVLKQSLGNAAEQIGELLLPALTELAKQAVYFATEVLPVWIDRSRELFEWLGKHKEVIYIVAGAIAGALVPAVWAWASGVVTAAAATAVALAPFYITGAVIGGVVAGLVWLWQNSDKVNKAIVAGWEKIKKSVGDVVDYLVRKFERLVELMSKVTGAPTKAMSWIGDKLHFASGGIVNAPLGMAVPAIVHGGERIIPANGLRAAADGGSGGGLVINISGNTIAGAGGVHELAQIIGDSIMKTLRGNTRI